MDKLLQKYENGECTAEERTSVEEWLQKQEWSSDNLSSCNQAVKNISMGTSVMDILQNEDTYLQELLDSFAQSKTSPEESEWVDNYIQSENLDTPSLYIQYNSFMKNQSSNSIDTINLEDEQSQLELKDMPALYKEYVSEFKLERYSQSLSIDELVHSEENFDKEISIDKMPSIYNDYILAMQSQEIDLSTESLISKDNTKQARTKIISLNTKIWRAVAAAAILIVGFFAIQNVTNNNNTLASTQTIEITDPDQALELTLAALGAAAHGLETGNNQLQKIKAVEKTDIFK